MTLNCCIFNVSFLRNKNMQLFSTDTKKKFILQSSGYTQVLHDDVSSTSVQTISADHANVSHFFEAILH